MDTLKYKDYEGTAELDMTRGVCRGKILFIDDLVTYESALPADLQREFEAAVDDYLETCSDLGREPQRPFRGQFNVRIAPGLHRAAARRAVIDGVSLNEVVVRALDDYVHAKTEVNHNVRVAEDTAEITRTFAAIASSGRQQWKTKHVH